VSTPARGSLRELFGSPTRALVLAGLGASFLASFDLLIVVSALPSAARDVGNIDNYALAAGAYSVASVVGMPLAGIVNDRIGPLRTLLVGSGVFFVGTVIGGTATSMDQIAAGRLLQGFGGGFLLSVPLVLWTAYLPRHLERHGFAVNAAVWAVSAVIGPPTGALLVALVDWRAVFWVNLPLLALTVYFALRGFQGRKFTPHEHARANILGPCLLGGFALGLLLPAPWQVISIPLALAFLWQETHTDQPLIPRHRSGYATCLIALSAGVAFTGGTTVITLALQAGSGWSVFWASFPLLMSSLTWTLGTGLVTHLHWSLRRIVTVGTAVVAAGTLSMAIPVSSGLAIAIGFTISGFGMGFASPALFPAALSDDQGREGRDTSAVTTARQLGAGIGAALAGFVLLETVPHAVLRAAENGESPLPQLHDAAGLAFGLLGLIVLLSLPATRAIRVAPRRARAGPEEAPATVA
jgi:MFS family permease